MYKYALAFLCLLCFGNGLAAKPDPKAKETLKKMKAQYERYKSVQTNFTMTIEQPGTKPQTLKGKLYEQGKNYRLEMPQQQVISDGNDLWIFLKGQNEVQITDADDSDANTIFSPRQLYDLYESKLYDYALSNDTYENGKAIQQIEFKPLDRRSDFSKMRLTLDKKTMQPLNIKVFSKDGSRYTLVIDKILPNQKFDKNIFAFNAKQYPGANIEDLRLD
jgi:outer membrane lipoprotein carrier protein